MKYSRRGFVTSTGPNFRASKVQPALASTPSFSSSLQKQGCKKFRDSGRRQWALVDRPAAQNAAKGKHGKYIWEASHWGKNQAENVHLIIFLFCHVLGPEYQRHARMQQKRNYCIYILDASHYSNYFEDAQFSTRN